MKQLLSFISKLVLRIFLFIWGLTIIFPLIWMIYSSFKNNAEFYESPWVLPSVMRFSNYAQAWTTARFSDYFFNSFIVVVGSLALFFIMVTTTSYVLAKYKFRGSKLFNDFYLLAMMVPSVLLLVTRYFHLLSLNLTDNLFILILLYAVGAVPGSAFILVGFIKGIDNSFIEAAVVDGASEWCIYKDIILPFVKPAVFLVCLNQVMGSWNDFTTALTYIKDESLYTVPVGLSYLTNSMSYHADYGPMFAALVLTMIPILIIYIFFQKQLLRGAVASDGVKG